jgi:cell division protein FtsI (penicillin-binding protein 3)
MTVGRTGRLRLCLVVLVFAFAGLVGRAAYIQVHDGARLAALAARQSLREIEVAPRRGPIYDRDGGALALSLSVESVYARPRSVRAADVPRIAAALGMPAGEVRARLDRRRSFVWLKRQVPPAVGARARALGAAGVGIVPEPKRFYPNGGLAGHLLGFAGLDGRGLEGIERAYDEVLRGDAAHRAEERDAKGRRLLPDGLDPESLAPEGAGLVLTIDRRIQFAAEEALAGVMRESGASGGSAVVLDPATGDVLALANAPRFDPNRFADARPAAWRNRVVTDVFEPGSTIKVFLAAAAIDAGVVSPGDLFFAEHGVYHLGRRVVRDVHPEGWLTLPDILRVSSNIGAIKVGERVGAARYRRALARFGFGRPTGIALPGEVDGTLHAATRWTPVSMATASYGYGLAVTPIQLAAAFAAIANDGVAVTPRLVRGSLLADGTLVALEGAEAAASVRRVIAPETAHRLTSMLEAVAGPDGTGHLAALDGYAVAGKTGTARKIEEGGGYARDRHVSSFVGFVPADAPRFVIAVFVDEPKESIYGGVVAAPAFRAIAEAGLAAYRVPPSRPSHGPPVPPRPAAGSVVLASTAGRSARAEVTDLSVPIVPDFSDLGIREALDLARTHGLSVRVEGQGWAVRQRPAPGAPLPRDGRVTVGFEP